MKKNRGIVPTLKMTEKGNRVKKSRAADRRQTVKRLLDAGHTPEGIQTEINKTFSKPVSLRTIYRDIESLEKNVD